MSSFFLVKTAKGNLIPADEGDMEKLKKIPNGEFVKCEYKKTRNYRHHKKYWALIGIVYNNLPEGLAETIRSEEELHTEVKMQAGVRQKRVSLSGKEYYIPGSIAFDKMSQEDFNEFYSKALDIICKWILPGTISHDLEMQVMEFLK